MRLEDLPILKPGDRISIDIAGRVQDPEDKKPMDRNYVFLAVREYPILGTCLYVARRYQSGCPVSPRPIPLESIDSLRYADGQIFKEEQPAEVHV